MRRVIVESPYAGDVDLHLAYLRDCLRDCYQRGEAPIASHAIGPLVLDDTDPEQRAQGIAAGLAWHAVADAVVFYTDLGVSSGMEAALHHARRLGIPVEDRTLARPSRLLMGFDGSATIERSIQPHAQREVGA